MTAVRVAGWAGVAPGLDVLSESWRDWARDPRPFTGLPETRPELGFLPALQRRRCDTLSRMMLAVANACCDEADRREALSVFASRHGSFGATVTMLETLARDESLSPTRFSHSVHNTQAGLFSIWTGNQQLAQSLASRNETFEHGFLEAVCLLGRARGRPVLLVAGDEALPEPVAHLSADPHPAHAVGLLLRAPDAAATDGCLDFELEAGAGAGGPAEPLPWPPAIEFLRWWIGDEESLSLGRAPRRFVFRRRQPARPV